MAGCIYALKDPRDNEIRYIGQTSDKLANRLKGHISAAKRGAKWHNANWIRELLTNDLRPVIELIEDIDVSLLDEREEYWIDYYKKAGCKLTNYGIGGGSHRKYKEPTEDDIRRAQALLHVPYTYRSINADTL